jgi:hypothetical protein
MLLSSITPHDSHHELDFRFEVFPGNDEFLFAHHGGRLSELAKVVALSKLGSVFYMVEANYPFTINDVVADKTVFQNRYGVEPDVVHNRYLRFDLNRLDRFFESTQADCELDCFIVGADTDQLSDEDLERFVKARDASKGFLRLSGFWRGSWLHTHDNHFLWLVARSLDLLKSLIAASIVGFFRHVHHYDYTAPSDALVDLIVSQYHTAPLVCFPTRWHDTSEVPGDVQVDANSVRALVETAETSWIAYHLNPPRHLVGRRLLISYSFHDNSWSWEKSA